MKKTLFSAIAIAAFAMTGLTSCMTINSGAAISSNTPVGTKMGEAQSKIFLGIWSSQGQQNNIQQAAANGGITKLQQVEYVDQSILCGLYIIHTTRVYGE